MKSNEERKIELSIVLPCLNEAETLETCIKKAKHSIKKYGLLAEIVVADNGSTDGSVQIAESNGARVVHVKGKGYGAALAGGINGAEGKYIVMGDSDDSYDFGNIFPFIEKLRQGYDLVMGCRLPSGGGQIMPGAMPLKHRYLGNPVLSFLGRLFFTSPVTDFHCGLRAFSKNAALKMGLKTTGMEFASEMVIKATLMNMKITEVPITLYKDGRSRPPHLRSWRDGWRHLRFMLIYSPRYLFLLPGALFLIIGFCSFIALIKGPVSFGSINFDTNSLLVSAISILIGFQLVTFYFFTKTFAITEGFLPEDSFLNRLFDFLNLEVGILLGLVFLSVGAFFLLTAVSNWADTGFGDLSYSLSLRKVIPAVIMIVLGIQIIFSSFFMSMLGLQRK